MSVCLTRKPYREGRKPTAVKAYTIHNESRYLIVENVANFAGVDEDLRSMFSSYGDLASFKQLEDYPASEPFTHVYWVKFIQLPNARVAKRKIDDKHFFGHELKVSYAPQYETVDDTRQKLVDRRKTVVHLVKKHQQQQQQQHKGSSGQKGGNKGRRIYANTTYSMNQTITSIRARLDPEEERDDRWQSGTPIPTATPIPNLTVPVARKEPAKRQRRRI